MTQELAGKRSSGNTYSDERHSRCVAFLSAIQELYADDRGKIAVLKRNSGNILSEARGLYWIYHYLLRHLPGQHPRQDNICVLVAGLMCFDRTTLEKGLATDTQRNFARSLSDLRSPEERTSQRPGQTSLERRLVALLDATFDEDGGGEMAFRIRQAARFALSKDARIDWPLLLEDLLDWGRPGKPIQKQWARSFYEVREADTTETEVTAGA